MRRLRTAAPAWAALLLVLAMALAAATGPALAGSTSSPRTAAEWGAAWLADQVSPEGWVVSSSEVAGTIATGLALAAVGVEHAAFSRAVEWVEDHYHTWSLDRPGALGQLILLAVAAGKDPRSFGGLDLVTRIAVQRQPAGDDPGMYGPRNKAAAVFLQSFALLGLRAAGATVARDSIDWLLEQQCPEGYWPTYREVNDRKAGTCAASDPESDATAMAVQALYALGELPRHDARVGLLAFQGPGGGFVSHLGQSENSNSTGLVLQAIAALGEHPGSGRWRQNDGDSALSALLALQYECTADQAKRGSFRWLATSTGVNLLATAQATWGMSGRSFPLTTGRPSSTDVQVCVTTSPSTSPPPSGSASPSGSPSPSTSPTSSPTASPSEASRSVERVSGENRFSSSAAVAREAFLPGVPVAFLATGRNFADALAAGPAGATLGGPVLLTEPDQLPDAVSAELQRLLPERIVLLGGRAAITERVAEAASRYGPVERISGPDRYETAGALSRWAFPNPTGRVLIATGEDFPDALAGIGASADSPILLTGRDELPLATESELRRLAPTEVFVLGGANAVSERVADRIRAIVPGATIQRLSGTDRYQTAVAATRAGVDEARVIYVATGEEFPDALAAAAPAGMRHTGILLVGRDQVPSVVLDELRRLDPQRVIILGGPASVSEEVARQLRAA